MWTENLSSLFPSYLSQKITHSITQRIPEVKIYLDNTVSNAMFRYNSRWNLAAASKKVIFAVTSNAFYMIAYLIFQRETLKEIHVKFQASKRASQSVDTPCKTPILSIDS